jgi:hypothetical protein
MVTLDRILVSTKWEDKHPLYFAWNKTRVGSDHWPIFLDSGENSMKRQKHFFFEKQWLMEQDFLSVFEKMWVNCTDRFRNLSYSMDFWYKCLCAARQYLKGWSANKSSETKKEKKDILSRLEELDRSLESQGENDRLWVERYHLEGKLE